MYNPVSKIDELFPDFAELDQTVAEMQERQNQIITDFNFIIRQVAETAKTKKVRKLPYCRRNLRKLSCRIPICL